VIQEVFTMKKLHAFMALSLSVGTLFAVPASAQTDAPVDGVGAAATANLTAESSTLGLANLAPNDRITRLYRATLGREPDLNGHEYWVEQIGSGASLLGLTRALMHSQEATSRSTGDPIRDAYLWALGREPDAAGYAYWIQFDAPLAVLQISDSAEHKLVKGGEVVEGPIAVQAAPSAPQGWVDAGHGVFVPPILLAIRACESHDNYLAANPRSSARGAYQFLMSSWAAYGHAARYGVLQAHQASPAQQDEAALITWKASGTSPWNASRSCWG
jgi:hypothetical protein